MTGLSFLVTVVHVFTFPATAQVVVNVATVVSALGGEVAVTCLSSEPVMNVEWLINGTSLNQLNVSDITQEFITTLRFRNTPAEYNGTRISCVLNGVRSRDTSTLFVQGLLSAVESLNVTITDEYAVVNWTAPFTLDLTATTLDITYCVDVVSLFFSSLLHSKCGIIPTEFRYPLLQRSECSQFNFTVTPVNLVGNGTKRSVQLLQDDDHALIDLIASRTTFYIFLSVSVCYADLRFEDVHSGDIVSLSFNLTTAASNVTIQSQLLKTNRQYRLTILEFDAEVASVVVSTHDVTSCSAFAENGGIAISVNFVEDSFATGVLIAFVSLNNSGTIDLTSSFLQVFNKSSITNGVVVPLNSFHSESYVAYAYDIEESQTINDGILYHADSCSFNVSSNQATTPLPPQNNSKCVISGSEKVITVSCSFTSFQVLAQLNAQDSVGILHVNTSVDTKTPVTLHVPENGEYLVSILPIEGSRGILSEVAYSQLQIVSDEQVTTANDMSSQVTVHLPTSSLPSSTLDILTIGIVVRAAAFAVLAVSA